MGAFYIYIQRVYVCTQVYAFLHGCMHLYTGCIDMSTDQTQPAVVKYCFLYMVVNNAICKLGQGQGHVCTILLLVQCYNQTLHSFKMFGQFLIINKY
jgi:hypothetical protein